MVTLRIIEKGEHFGEIDMLYAPKHLHREEARATSKLKLLAIVNQDLKETLDDFKNYKQEFMEDVEQTMEKNAAILNMGVEHVY